MAKNKLSIYLIKQDIAEPVNIFIDGVIPLQEFSDTMAAYYYPSPVREPDWLNNFFHIRNADLRQASSKAVLLVKLDINDEERFFILAFGRGKNLLREDVVEEQFGLKILLNSVERNQLRKITKVNIGGNQKSSQEQIPKSSTISEFGFDIDRDLIRNVTAKSNDEQFEKSMLTGGDIFSLTVEKDITNIEDFLRICYLKYQENTYTENFDWLDNIKEVKSVATKQVLDNLLVAAINNREFDRVWMAVPEVVIWEHIRSFRFSGIRGQVFDDIYINKVIESFEGNMVEDVKQLKTKKIFAISAADERENEHIWTAYQCTFAELDYSNDSYCFNSGKWYKIRTNFAETINQEYERLPISQTEFLPFSHINEGEYNNALVGSLEGSVLLHENEIYYGGGAGNQIEVCDVLTRDKKLIHIKRKGGSSLLSHHFNQGSVSGEALLDSDFRHRMNLKLLELGKLENVDEDFNSGNYTVVFALITDKHEDRPSIPFFSRVAVRYAVKTLRNLGYRVEIKNIPPALNN